MTSKLEKIYEFLSKKNLNYKNEIIADYIFDLFDDLFLDGNFEEANKLFLEINLDVLNIELIIILLALNKQAEHELKDRNIFVSNCISRIKILAPDRLDALTKGFL